MLKIAAPKLKKSTCPVIHPLSWLEQLLQNDLKAGFTGKLDEIAPEQCGCDIFCSRQRSHQPADEGRIELWQEVEGVWWPGESVGQWWDGFMRHAFLCGDSQAITKVRRFVGHLLQHQDKDGYIGIYTPGIRYRHRGENGDIWASTCILRMLLGFFYYSQERQILDAVEKAVARIMKEYPLKDFTKTPFHVERPQGGVGHSLMLTDVLKELHEVTGHEMYARYAARFYEAYCDSSARENDMQAQRVRRRGVPLRGHAPHTAEHVRSLLFWTEVDPSLEKQQIMQNCLWKLKRQVAESGPVVGDEPIKEMLPSGERLYEYCVIHEYLVSCLHLLKSTGVAAHADAAENLLFNAAMGARMADGSGITYLTSDNQTELPGASKDPKLEYLGGRRKMSPAHADTACCCNPNAARIFPYYIESMWLESPDEEKVWFALLGPSSYKTILGNSAFHFKAITDYPFSDEIQIRLDEAPVSRRFTLCIRKPSRTESYSVTVPDARISCEDDWIHIDKVWTEKDTVDLKFNFAVERVFGICGEEAIRRGPLIYAMPIPHRRVRGQVYPKGFCDYTLFPKTERNLDYFFLNPGRAGSLGAELVRNKIDRDQSLWENPPLRLRVPMEDLKGNKKKITFVPMGCSPLRKVFFPVNWSKFDPREDAFINTDCPLPPEGV